MSDGKHSITFGDKNTYDDWHIVASSRPVFNPPKVKEQYVDIPGANGTIDLGEALTGYPLYQDSEGSFEFYVLNGYQDWSSLYSSIMNYLHGRRMKCWLEDDPLYYREGKFEVDKWKSESYWSKITIKYRVNPFKWSNQLSTEEWIWDTFNFETDVVMTSIWSDISVSGTKTLDYGSIMYGTAPVQPVIISSANMKMRFICEATGVNETYNLVPGENTFDDVMLAGDRCVFTFTGTGNVSIRFNPGRL